MIETYFVCDKCKEKTPIESANFATLQLTIAWGERGITPYDTPTRLAQWCRKCIQLAGVNGPVEIRNDFTNETRLKTSEEIIIELLVDLGFTRDQAAGTV